MHGGGHDAWAFGKVAPYLAREGHAVIAPDLPGHGLNASFPESWWSRAQDPGRFAAERSPLAQLTLTDLGAAVTAVVQQVLRPGRQIILVGHSMAGVLLNWTGEAADAVDRAGDAAAQVKDLVPEGVDVTIDLVGPAVWQSALAATRTGGRLITTSGPGSLPDVERGITALPVKVQPDAASLTSLAERYANRSLTMRLRWLESSLCRAHDKRWRR